MIAYYNEHDRRTAAWLRQLIRDGLVAPGDVDERDIQEVQPDDLRRYTQVHLFAGIGGWSAALRLAGWPDDRPVWTGSCPCQPFSAAGSKKGHADARHLWPEMFRLISECCPERIFGEQVASAIRHGWLDGISADLEGADYAVGSIVLGAHSVGSPHIRQRLYWVADAELRPAERQRFDLGNAESGVAESTYQRERIRVDAGNGCTNCGLVLPERAGLERHARHGHDGNEPGRHDKDASRSVAATGGVGWVCDSACIRCEENRRRNCSDDRHGGAWDDYEIIWCRDPRGDEFPLIPRRIEPGLAPLAHGLPARVVRLSGYGNAIVPQLAAEFIRACGEAKRVPK